MQAKRMASGLATLLVAGVVGVLAIRGNAATERTFSIEGTYTLLSRDLPDGSKQTPPAVIGLLTFTKTYRNFNVYWVGAGGNVFSSGAISTYTLSPKQYTEKNIYFAVNDEGKAPSYDLSDTSGSSPVSIKDGHIEFDLPLHGEPRVSFSSDGFTATRAGAFVDHWKKIK